MAHGKSQTGAPVSRKRALDDIPRDAAGRLVLPATTLERFWEKIDSRAEDACWPWVACRNEKGYGHFGVLPGVLIGAHRLAYMLCVGPIPEGFFICHACDNPPCCNPRHLRADTPQANAEDLRRRGRSSKPRTRYRSDGTRWRHARAGHIKDLGEHFPRDQRGRLQLPDRILDRFWTKIDRSAGDQSCWPWIAARKSPGTGSFGLTSTVNVHPHRLVYELTVGEIPAGYCVHQTCGNPACCNSRHLQVAPGARSPGAVKKGEGADRSAYRSDPGRWREPAEARFWRLVERSEDPDGCWEWSGHRGRKGYGVFCPDARQQNKVVQAHRFAFEHAVRPLEPGELVLHRCDNRACVRPDHLFAGSQRDNIRDAWSKGRMVWQRKRPTPSRGDRNGARLHPERLPRGEAHHRTRLTEPDVVYIRLAVELARISMHALAEELGVSCSCIWDIVHRRSWGHVR